MIIDAHCHIVPSAEGVATTVKRMEQAKVTHTLAVPGGMIPALGLADFLRGTKPLQDKAPNNGFILDLSLAQPRAFSAMYQFDPRVDDTEDAERALAAGFCGFKLNPLVDKLSFDDPMIDELFALCSAQELPVYTHVVLSGGASLGSLTQALGRHPGLHLILGHMGFASSDGGAITAAFRFPNLLLETSVGAFQAIEGAYHRLGAGKLVFGSEGPAHHPAVEMRKIELLNLPSAAFEDITWRNIARFLSLAAEPTHAV